MLLLAILAPAQAQQTISIENTPTDSSGITHSAEIVPADSIRMIVLPESGEIAFLIPQSVAYHYRSLVLDMVPALEQKIQLLEDASEQQLSLSDNRLSQIQQLELQRENLQTQVNIYQADAAALKNQLDEVNKARKREILKKKFWRGSNFLFMGTTAILTVVLLGN